MAARSWPGLLLFDPRALRNETELTPESVTPAYERLADTLRDQILSGELQPGDQLPVEPELCARYGVSRGTAREALRVLSSQKLVVTTRGVAGGTFVIRPSPEHVSMLLKPAIAVMSTAGGVGTVDDLLDVRQLLEVPAAGLAAERRNDEHLADMRSCLFDPRQVAGATTYAANRDFHRVVLQAAGNPMLEAVTAPIFGVLQQRFAREQASDRFWRRVDKDHRSILALIEEQDVDGARQAQAEHLDHLHNTYVRIDREARGETVPRSTKPTAAARGGKRGRRTPGAP